MSVRCAVTGEPAPYWKESYHNEKWCECDPCTFALKVKRAAQRVDKAEAEWVAAKNALVALIFEAEQSA